MDRRGFIRRALADMIGAVATLYVPGKPWTLGVQRAYPGWMNYVVKYFIDVSAEVAERKMLEALQNWEGPRLLTLPEERHEL